MLHKTLSDCASSQSVVGGGRGVNQIIIYLAGPSSSSCHSRHNGEGGRDGSCCMGSPAVRRNYQNLSMLNKPRKPYPEHT